MSKGFRTTSGFNVGKNSKKVFGCQNCNFALDHALWKKNPAISPITGPGCDCPNCYHEGSIRLFDSHAEYTRAAELKEMQRQGIIWDLEYQHRFDLHVPGPDETVKIGQYVADFTYSTHNELGDEDWVVEDVKNKNMVVTDIFAWKKKHFKAEYGIEINMVGR